MKKKVLFISAMAVLVLAVLFSCHFFVSDNLYEESWADDMYSASFEINGKTVQYSTGDYTVPFKDINGKLNDFDRAFRSLRLKKLDTDPLASENRRAKVCSDNTEFIFKTGQTAQGKETASVSFYTVKPERMGIYEINAAKCNELLDIIGSMFTYEEYPAKYDTSAVDGIISQEWEWIDGATGKDRKNYIIEDEYAQEILTALKSDNYTPADRDSLKIEEDYNYITLYNENNSVQLRFHTAYYPDHRMIKLLEFEIDGTVYSYEVDFNIYTSILFGNGHNLIVDEMFRDWKEFSYCEYEFSLDRDSFSASPSEINVERSPLWWVRDAFIYCHGAEHEFMGKENSEPAFVLNCGAETDNGIVYDKITLTCSDYGIHTRYWLKAELENHPDFLEWEDSYCYELSKADYDNLLAKAKNAKEVYDNDGSVS